MIKGFILREKNAVKYYTVPAFSETGLVKHAFSTRLGGVSKEPYDSLNLGFHTGDDFNAVRKNRLCFTQSLGIPMENLVAASQIHGDKVYAVDSKDKGKGAFDEQSVIQETDALITNKPEVALIAFYADCVPIMFLDPVAKVIAIAHAGWKGTVLKIGQKTLLKMKEIYGCKPQNTLAAICPSIGPCHYEVDTPVIEQFKKNFQKWEQIIHMKSADKAQLNLWEANRLQLIEVGIPTENITVAEICTFCHPELLYSYRYNNGKTGRLAGIIMLKEE